MTPPVAMARTLLALLVGAPAWGCGGPPTPTAQPGEPLPGLSPSERVRFEAGRAMFDAVFLPERGLGPAFNENQCSACHTSPASGGVGGERVHKGTRYDAESGCDLLEASGGLNVRRKVTLPGTAAGIAVESLPAGATRGRFTAPALFGIGLIDAVPLAALEALADPDDADGDGISGRVGRTADGRPARFGRKADVATLADFVAAAAHLEMGLTSPAHPTDLVQGGSAADGAPDPELDLADLGRLDDYVRMLAPPGRGPPPSPWSIEAVARGERTFRQLGCARCHVPHLDAGPSDLAAVAGRRIGLYSDLLLHDMGPELADVCGPGALPAEVRTEPLLGLRYRELLLHDGRTTDLERAVRLHGGEATASRDGFARLRERERLEVLAFLRTL